MSRRIDHATATKISAAFAARAAFGERFAYNSAQLAGLLQPLVSEVFARPMWLTCERHAIAGPLPDRRIAGKRS
ncbi:hypothetical protein ASE26_28755 [Duganella sp. Root198D2]|nr:hypothetical protein ASD07_28970 [Duganella sp. Root336D2]KRB92799.1 hypothetical protein ASE26_28755 [Duganella sp. Root198D2]